MSTAFRSMGMSIVEIGLPSFVVSISGSLTSYGLIIGIFSVTQCLFQYPYAAASDKFGRRRIVLIGMIIYLVGTFLCFFAQNIPQLIIYRAIQGAGAYTSILQAIIGDIYNKNQHSKGMGYYSLYMNLGYFLGFIIGGYIASLLGFRSIFLLNGFLICFSIIFIFFVLKEDNTADTIKNQDFNINNIKILLKERQYIYSLLTNCVRWFLFGFITAYLIWVLQNHAIGFGLDEITSSYIMLGILALYVLSIFISSKLLHYQGPRKMMITGQLMVLLFGIPFFFPDFAMNLPIFLTIICFLGIGIALFDPAGNTLLLEVIEDIQPDLKGSGIGFNNAIGFFCGAIAPMIMSPLGEIYILIPFYAIFVLMIFSLIISVVFVDKKY